MCLHAVADPCIRVVDNSSDAGGCHKPERYSVADADSRVDMTAVVSSRVGMMAIIIMAIQHFL